MAGSSPLAPNVCRAPARGRGGSGAVTAWTGQLQLPLWLILLRGPRLARLWQFSSAESQGLARQEDFEVSRDSFGDQQGPLVFLWNVSCERGNVGCVQQLTVEPSSLSVTGQGTFWGEAHPWSSCWVPLPLGRNPSELFPHCRGFS